MINPGDEIVTFVSRSLEPYRGYHAFMRSLPEIMAKRPQAQVVIVGAQGVSYGASAPDGQSWRDIYLNEVRSELDESRIIFTGTSLRGIRGLASPFQRTCLPHLPVRPFMVDA